MMYTFNSLCEDINFQFLKKLWIFYMMYIFNSLYKLYKFCKIYICYNVIYNFAWCMILFLSEGRSKGTWELLLKNKGRDIWLGYLPNIYSNNHQFFNKFKVLFLKFFIILSRSINSPIISTGTPSKRKLFKPSLLSKSSHFQKPYLNGSFKQEKKIHLRKVVSLER
jgi:hypothetical protein